MIRYRNLLRYRPYRRRNCRSFQWKLRQRKHRRRRGESQRRQNALLTTLLRYNRIEYPSRPHSGRTAYQPAEERKNAMGNDLLTNGVSAVYVDTENLTPAANADSVDFAQSLISRIVNDWPDDYPPIGRLALYVPADKTSQWRIWASSLMSNRTPRATTGAGWGRWREPVLAERNELVKVHGVQHFSRSNSKNSADMAIALDVVDDLLLSQRADFAAVFSNDSDFYALFDKLQEIVVGLGHPAGAVPLLWIVAPNGNNLSSEIKRFLLPHFVWDLLGESKDDRPSESTQGDQSEVSQDIIQGLVSQMNHNQQYRASELHDICKSSYPDDEMSGFDTAVFGMYLKNSAPQLSDLGVEIISTSNTSRYVRR